jgi:DNA repair protein RadC
MTQRAQIAAYLRHAREDAREHLAAIYLDSRLRPIGDAIVSIATGSSTAAYPREVFQMAVALSTFSERLWAHPGDRAERPRRVQTR